MHKIPDKKIGYADTRNSWTIYLANTDLQRDCGGMRTILVTSFCLVLSMTISIVPHSSLAGDRLSNSNVTSPTVSHDWQVQGGQSFATCQEHAVIIQGNSDFYASIQAAYEDAGFSAVIYAQALTFYGDLLLDAEKTVQLIGGYDCGFSSNEGMTIVTNQLTIMGGQA
ncbi:MAG TPA: hypothetical protein VMB78_08840, partial [Dissulfurispiraceae bacterium]|nr:hypothetical protein [Dissulfurispiraceae bacterium]